jgi:hypothetical protein
MRMITPVWSVVRSLWLSRTGRSGNRKSRVILYLLIFLASSSDLVIDSVVTSELARCWVSFNSHVSRVAPFLKSIFFKEIGRGTPS